MIARIVFAALLLLCAPAFAAGTSAPQTIVHILDYVGVDYSGAVQGGKITSEDEYKEMTEFTTQVVEQIKALPAAPQRERLSAQANDLAKLVADKADAAQVAKTAGALRWAIIEAYNVPVAPTKAPDLARASTLYAQHCTACHGAEGRGDGPAAKGMEPPPANFHNAERMAKRDRYGLYNTITLGVSGTAMQGYGTLSEDDRWGLAYHVASIGAGAQSPLAYARATLKETLDAYRKGEHARAQQLAVAAYLEGFELVEPALDSIDRELREAIERDMLQVRTLMRDRADASVVEAHIARTAKAIELAEEKLGGSSLTPGAAGASAFIILLREGLEAILVLAAIVAFLVKAGRRDALRYIHAGWIAALALGIVTWFVARYLVAVSGAGREMTEGVTALVSAGILLYVGWWLHDKSHARAWKQFIEQRLAGAFSRGTIGALASLSFLAVYREVFEMVLFYEALWLQAGEGGQGSIIVGFIAAAAALAVIAWLIFRYGVRLPITLFFTVSSVFLALLAIIFTGQGIGALQEAGAVGATFIDAPRVPLLGIFPTVQSLAAQAFVCIAVIAVPAWSRISARGSERR
ncbi:MAG TPA: cytochrome c/FTR1 family iron permease [Burkholderiales bacterium]|nr:cytochrome c/FTR1 family iron permease [Burkholderiales bacterium]